MTPVWRLANNTGGGGEQNWPWALGTSFYKGVKFERGENWSHKTQVFHFLFSVYFLFAIQVSNHKNYSKVEKYWGAFAPLPPLQVTPMGRDTDYTEDFCDFTKSLHSNDNTLK
jgi:hypothetical protein